MLNQCQQHASSANLVIGCAAVCDYRVAQISSNKIKKGAEQISLELIKNPDILATIKQEFPQLAVVGFAAETENLLQYAKQKLAAKKIDLIVANDVSQQQVFNHDLTQINLISASGRVSTLDQMTKTTAANKILDAALELC